MKRLLPFFLVIFSVEAAFSQCLQINANTTSVSCYNANDGQVTVDVIQGVAPYTYELFLFRPGFGQTPMGSVSTTSTSVTFQTGNGTLLPAFEIEGIHANTSLNPVGNEYRILVTASGSGGPFCETLGITGLIVTEPPQIGITLNDTDPDCDPAAGVGVGKIDVSVSGGTAPYTITWAGPTAIPDGTTVTASVLDAGMYTVTVTDASNCVHSLNIDVPVATQADAGPPTGVACGVNSFALSGNTPGGGEIGIWTGPPGVTFSPHVNAPNAVANNLGPGVNVLRWRIVDAGGICAGTFDEIEVTMSPGVSLAATVTDVLCHGASTGAIDINIAGGISPFTYEWSNGAVTQDLTNIPAGVYSVTLTDAASCTAVLNNITVSEPAEVVSGTTSQVDVLCFGASTGSITVTGAGGVGPYDFSIDGGTTYAVLAQPSHTFNGLVADDYDIVVRDANGCVTAVIPVTITQPAAVVSGSTSQTDVTCFGANTGEIVVTGAGGVGPYDFSNDGGLTYAVVGQPAHTFSSLVADDYDIVVRDANGCVSAIIPVTITQPAAAVSGTTSKIDVTCFGANTGEITVTGTGGVGPYDFSNDGGLTYAMLDQPAHTFTGLAADDYDIVVRDASGCTSTVIQVTITQPAAVVDGNISTVDVACFGASTGEITVTGTGGVGPYDFSNDGGLTYAMLAQPAHTFTGLGTGNYDIVVRDANGCASVIIPVTITQPAAAVSGTTSQVDVTCFGANTGEITVTGIGGVGPYDFSNDGGLTYGALGQPSHTFTGLIADDYDVVVRDANGCVSAVIPITLTQPAAVVSGSTSQIDVMCFGANTGEIAVTGTGGVGPYDFSNDGGLTFAAQGQPSYTFTGLVADDYDIVVRDANGCVSVIIPVTITQPAAAVSANTSKTDVLCFGAATGEITVTGIGGVGPYDFSNDGGITYTALGQPSYTFTGLVANDYDIVVRDANGCVSAVSAVTVTQPAAAVTAGIAKTDVMCFGGNTGEITVTGNGGIGPYDFSNDGGLTFAMLDQPSHTFAGLAAGDYDIVVRDANGCISSIVTVTITEPAEVTAAVSATGDVTVCEGALLPDVVFTFTGFGPFDFTYTDGSTSVNVTDHPENTFTLPTAPAGTYSVTSLTDFNGCVAVNLGGTITVTEEMAATVQAGGDQPLCSGQTTTLGGSSIGGSASTGTWSIVDQPAGGDGMLGYLGATNNPDTVTFSASVAGNYTLRLTTNDPGTTCGPVADDVVITVAAAATVDAGAAQEICVGESVQLSATFAGATSVLWTTSGNGTFDDATLVDPVYTPGAADIALMSVTLTATTVGPCAPASDDVVITLKAAPVVDAGTPQTICSDASVVLSGSFSGSATGLVWSTSGDGTFSDVTDPDASYTPGSVDSTNQSVTLRATATGSCAGVFDEVIITVNPAALVDAGGPQTVCIGSNVSLNAILSGSATTVAWTSSGTGAFGDATSPVTTYTPSAADLANGTVTLTATTNNPPGPCPAHNDNVVVTFIPIPGDQVTAGDETWIGYVYDDAGDPTPIPAKIDFDATKYRGFVDETDLASMTPASTYEVATDTFDLDLDMTPFQGTNVCGTYLNNFSVRFKMSKTFEEGVYRFTVGSDDGVRLLIDGVDVIPGAFGLHPYTRYTSDPYCLTAGVHSLELQYFENNGSARLSFSYEAVPEVITPSPVAVCMNAAAPDLTVSSTDGDVVNFNWYKDGTLVFTGATYTPGAGELDMSAVGTTTFSVTAVYGCGETPPVDVVVEVFDEAVLTLNSQTICEAGGNVDLRTLVSAVPPGGTFTFSGSPNIMGDFFDPTGLAGTTVSISVDYAIGSCSAPQGTLDVTVTDDATVTVPATPVLACESMAAIDLTTLVSAVPAGGTFTFTGPQITGNLFDPASLSGIQNITVDYNVGGCAAPQVTFDIDVTSTATITANATTACENGSPINLLTRVSAEPAGGAFTFTGPGVSGSLFDPSGQTGSINIDVNYDLNGCTANASLQVDVLDATDGICVAGNCASVVIVPQVFPATCTNSDGRMIMNITPPTPVVNNTGVKITIEGVSSTGLLITRTNFNDNVFDNLPVGNYDYTIEYGDPSCIKTGIFSIDQSGTVGTPVVSDVVSPLCAGTATGSLTLDVPGETGNILEWSLDGGLTDPFKPFAAGSKITGIPAGPEPTYQQVISVRRNAADVCFSSVTVTIPELVSPITATFSITPATCNGNDGAITGIVANGGHGAPFSYSIDGGQTFQPGTNFNGLAGGSYTLRVRDAGGCERDFAADVTFPGFINSNITKVNADCTNDGYSGSISVEVFDPGTYEVALSTDQFNPPAEEDYRPYTNPLVTFSNLGRGEYYVYVRSTSGVCPTRSAPITLFGVYDINFNIVPNCEGTDLSITLQNVTGESGGAPLEIQVFKKPDINLPYDTIFRQFPVDGDIFLSKFAPDITFLNTPGDYRIKITQFQSEAICNLSSDIVDLTVPAPLSAQVVYVSKSYPDIPTGELRVSGVSGGAYPFDVRIELDSASSFSQPFYQTEFKEAGLNADQQIEMRYNNVPPGRYHVEVMDSMGCVADLTARVPLDVDLFIPNVFTPNGDGSNDVFYIRNLPQEPAANVLIISNRWGKQVFMSENYQNNWDGEGVADGVYFYRLQVADNDPLTGWVEIMRGQKP